MKGFPACRIAFLCLVITCPFALSLVTSDYRRVDSSGTRFDLPGAGGNDAS